MKQLVEFSAPGKLMLFGEHAVVYERPCIVTAVDQRLMVKVGIASGSKVTITAPDVGIKDYEVEITNLGQDGDIPKGVKFVQQSVANFFNHYQVSRGIKIETKSEFSSEYGFGSSSAATVGTIASLSQLFQIECTKKDIFDLSYKTVKDVQGLGSGFDLAAAIWGGTLFYIIGGKKIESLEIDSLPLIIGYTGIKADTPKLVRRVASMRDKNLNAVESIFDSIEVIVNSAKELIEKQNIQELGNLMNHNQRLLRKLGMSSVRLDKMITAARNSGAYGAKLSGAGAGDCMIAIAPEGNRENVESSLIRAGGKIVKVKVNAEGLRRES